MQPTSLFVLCHRARNFVGEIGPMVREKLFQLLLLPFTLLYGISISLRNALYSQNIIKSVRFNLPVIGIGNLAIGGVGKTPHVEYLIRMLSPYLQVATLSRGYKRRSKGFRIVNNQDDATTVGDEPLQYALKYKEPIIAVAESRSVGIPMLLSRYPNIQVILLDDSYQHRSVTPSLNILLTEYKHPYSRDVLLPSGRLREWRSAADRADVIIVTKCPNDLSMVEAEGFRNELQVHDGQQLFFSRYVYGHPYPLLDGRPVDLQGFDEVVVISAIAQAEDLHAYIHSMVDHVHSMAYEDHHYFSPHEMSLLKLQYRQLTGNRVGILTTEKDATRLILHRKYIIDEQLPIFILPVRVDFLLEQGPSFDRMIQRHLMDFKT